MTDTNDLVTLTRALISAVGQTDVTEAEWEHGNFRLRIERQPTVSSDRPAMVNRAVSQPAAIISSETASVTPGDVRSKVLAPMHGMYYSAPDQSSPAFVSMGDRVVKGQVLCVIEAMKVFTNIAADHSGTIVSIGPSNGQEVVPGDLLFEIATSAER